jgi:hypothetical protein
LQFPSSEIAEKTQLELVKMVDAIADAIFTRVEFDSRQRGTLNGL